MDSFQFLTGIFHLFCTSLKCIPSPIFVQLTIFVDQRQIQATPTSLFLDFFWQYNYQTVQDKDF